MAIADQALAGEQLKKQKARHSWITDNWGVADEIIRCRRSSHHECPVRRQDRNLDAERIAGCRRVSAWGYSEAGVLIWARFAGADGVLDPVDAAIRVAASERQFANFRIEGFVPFDPAIKMVDATVIALHGVRRHVVKGAVAYVMAIIYMPIVVYAALAAGLGPTLMVTVLCIGISLFFLGGELVANPANLIDVGFLGVLGPILGFMGDLAPFQRWAPGETAMP
jgi:hypothetical protein